MKGNPSFRPTTQTLPKKGEEANEIFAKRGSGSRAESRRPLLAAAALLVVFDRLPVAEVAGHGPRRLLGLVFSQLEVSSWGFK